MVAGLAAKCVHFRALDYRRVNNVVVIVPCIARVAKYVAEKSSGVVSGKAQHGRRARRRPLALSAYARAALAARNAAS